MNRYVIKVAWTHFLRETPADYKLLEESEVLYLYATKKEPVYVGEAGRQTVKQRLESHEYDRVLRWVRRNMTDPCAIKIGYLILPKGIKFSLPLLHDIQTLIIYKESKERDFCRANKLNTATRKIYRPGMVIVNQGEYAPLLKRYYDDP